MQSAAKRLGLAYPLTSRPRHGATAGLLRHKGDTIDLLQSGFAAAHQIHGGIAQEARAVLDRRIANGAHRRARHDQFADFVVEAENFARSPGGP